MFPSCLPFKSQEARPFSMIPRPAFIINGVNIQLSSLHSYFQGGPTLTHISETTHKPGFQCVFPCACKVYCILQTVSEFLQRTSVDFGVHNAGLFAQRRQIHYYDVYIMMSIICIVLSMELGQPDATMNFQYIMTLLSKPTYI